MSLTEAEIRNIVEDTVRQLAGTHSTATAGTGRWLCDTAEEAVASAKAAQKQLIAMSLDQRGRLIEAMRVAARENARRLAEMAHEETGYGHVEDKVKKNLLAANKTPGIEDLTAGAFSGDYGLTLTERAPFGVIGSITPSTNPPSSIINNSISMIAAGNAVVFNPHPAAKKVSIEAMRILNEAIAQAGGPGTLICTVKEPTLESGKIIMSTRKCRCCPSRVARRSSRWP
jgi:propionaldehyde dehydrogenase